MGRYLGQASVRVKWVLGILVASLLLTSCGGPGAANPLLGTEDAKFTATSFIMDTVVTQTAYGPNAEKAMEEVNTALAEYENRFSLYKEGSDILAINLGAGKGGADVAPQTAELIQQALDLSPKSQGSFAISIAPLTLAWDINSETPRVLTKEEIEPLLPLVNDQLVEVEGNHVTLPVAGMGLDLGGIAKGAACTVAQQVYTEHGVESAILSIGGNIYARGKKPDGSLWRVGFRNPLEGETSYIANFGMEDKVIAVSGGYERYFEKDGVKYIHIIDPRTGMPGVSDIASVGVLDKDGAVADFYSTTLFLWGRDKTLDFMRTGAEVILLDTENRLYVSESLRESFALQQEVKDDYELIFIPQEEK